jgi:ATP-dependent Lon protease
VKNALEIIPVARMDEVLGIALVRKPEPIEWDEAAALAAAQLQNLSKQGAVDGDGVTLPH